MYLALVWTLKRIYLNTKSLTFKVPIIESVLTSFKIFNDLIINIHKGVYRLCFNNK